MKPPPTDKTGPRNRNQPQPSAVGATRLADAGRTESRRPASHDEHEKSALQSGWRPPPPPQEALDCACGLYLRDTAA